MNGNAGSDVPVADLHVHTTASDGELTLDALPRAARTAGVAYVAVTDHDRYHPDLDAPVTVLDGVTVIKGIELRVDAGTERVDLLGYGVRRTATLTDLVEGLQANRIERARAITGRVETRLGVDLDLEFGSGVGRPHIARAIAASDADYSYQGAFDELIGTGRPCYVAREIPSLEVGLDALSAACSIVALAHPFRYRNVEWALDLAADLAAVERYYPYDRPVDTERLDRVIAAADLLATGGSDTHGTTLGTTGPPLEAFEPFARRLGLSL